MNLGDTFREAARRNPQKTALICGNETVSYADLDRDTNRLAGWFLREGLQPGDRIAVHGTNSIPACKLFLACFKAGLIAVPVNFRLKAPEITYVLGHSKSVMCFSQPELAPIATEAGKGCAALRGIYTELPSQTEDAATEDATLPEISAGHSALIMYTSGTTSRPKGVTHTHQSQIHTSQLVWSLGGDGDDTYLVMTSLMHASGMCQFIAAMLSGATLVLVPAFDAAAVLDTMERLRCTLCATLPAMLQFVVEEQARSPRNVSSLRISVSGGDTVPVSLQKRFQKLFGIPVQEIFGMTESVPTCCNRKGAIRAGSIGKLMDGVAVRIVDLAGNDVPEGQTGEMVVCSPANFAGYWDDPEGTAAALQDGWLFTGDLVRRDADGYYWFEGRKKEIIIRGGSNISPQEVEEALYQHPAVLEAGVIGVPDRTWGEIVVACVSLREGHSADEQQVRDFARQRLADYKVPERIVFLREMPKGATGKVQRRALKEMVRAQGVSAGG